VSGILGWGVGSVNVIFSFINTVLVKTPLYTNGNEIILVMHKKPKLELRNN